MILVTDNYKLLDIEIDGDVRTERVDTSKAWNVVEVMGNQGSKTITVHEGNKIKFVVESGEVIEGVVEKLAGKGTKTTIQLIPENSECKQIWSVEKIQEDTLEVIK